MLHVPPPLQPSWTPAHTQTDPCVPAPRPTTSPPYRLRAAAGTPASEQARQGLNLGLSMGQEQRLLGAGGALLPGASRASSTTSGSSLGLEAERQPQRRWGGVGEGRGGSRQVGAWG